MSFFTHPFALLRTRVRSEVFSFRHCLSAYAFEGPILAPAIFTRIRFNLSKDHGPSALVAFWIFVSGRWIPSGRHLYRSHSSVCAAAQALKNAAQGIGAWGVVFAAEAVELAAASSTDQELESAVDRLGVVAEETRAAIDELLQGD